MSTILTNKFRLHNAISFKEGFSEGPSKTDEVLSTNIYMSIGKVTEWSSSDIFSGADDLSSDDIIPDPLDTVQSEFQVWRNMIALKKIQPSDVSHVIPRVDWKYGTVYSQYGDNKTTLFLDIYTNPFYILTEDFNVYKCLFNNHGSASTVQPVSTTTNGVVKTDDGYVWKYMYTVSSVDAYKFVTPNFVPVKRIETDVVSVGSGCSTDSNHTEVQNNAVDGEINIVSRDLTFGDGSLGSGYIFKLGLSTDTNLIGLDQSGSEPRTYIKLSSNTLSTSNNYYNDASVYFPNPGTGKSEVVFQIDEYVYSSNEDQTIYIKGDQRDSFEIIGSELNVGVQILPTVIIEGDGTGVSVIPEMSDITGTVSGVDKIKVINGGSGYTKANVSFINASGYIGDVTSPKFNVAISPKGGHGFDAVRELGGFFIMINTKFNFDEYNITTNNDFRQVSLVRDPIDNTTGSLATENGYVQTKVISLQSEEPDQPFSNAVKDKIVRLSSDSKTNGIIVDVIQETLNEVTTKKVRVSNTNGNFEVGQTIQVIAEDDTILSQAVIQSIESEEVQPFSGDIVFIEQRNPVNRDKNQIEDIKIILEF